MSPFKSTLYPPAVNSEDGSSGVDWQKLFRLLPRSQAEADAAEEHAGASVPFSSSSSSSLSSSFSSSSSSSSSSSTSVAVMASGSTRAQDAFACGSAFKSVGGFDWALSYLGDRNRSKKLPINAAALLAQCHYDGSGGGIVMERGVSEVGAVLGAARLWGAMAARAKGPRNMSPRELNYFFGSGFKNFWETARIHACQVLASDFQVRSIVDLTVMCSFLSWPVYHNQRCFDLQRL